MSKAKIMHRSKRWQNQLKANAKPKATKPKLPKPILSDGSDFWHDPSLMTNEKMPSGCQGSYNIPVFLLRSLKAPCIYVSFWAPPFRLLIISSYDRLFQKLSKST